MIRTDPQIELLQSIASSLETLVKLNRMMAYPTIGKTLKAALSSEQRRLVYQYLDGSRTVAEIQELTGVNARYISQWGQEWEELGIVESGGRKGRRRKSFDLSTIGVTSSETVADDQGGTTHKSPDTQGKA